MEPPRSPSSLSSSPRGLESNEVLSPPAASTVQYQEAGEDEDDEDEQLFIETIRRGALAVQQRRRRLLDSPPRRRAEPVQQRNDDGSSSSINNNSGQLLAETPSQSTALRPRSLHSTSLLAAHLNATASASQSTWNRDRNAAASNEHDVASSMMLLYCDSSPTSTTLPAGSQARDPTTASGNRSGGNNITNERPYTRDASPEQHKGGGGCGRLVCARAFKSKLDPDKFESDAPPSHQLVDWLEIVPARDDETKWPHLCDCIRATLGCRNW